MSVGCGRLVHDSILPIIRMTIADDAKSIAQLFTEHKWATLFVLFLMITLPAGWTLLSKTSSNVIDNRGSNGGVFIGRDNNRNISISISQNQVISAQPVSLNQWNGKAYEHEYEIEFRVQLRLLCSVFICLPRKEFSVNQTTSKLGGYQATTTSDGRTTTPIQG